MPEYVLCRIRLGKEHSLKAETDAVSQKQLSEARRYLAQIIHGIYI